MSKFYGIGMNHEDQLFVIETDEKVRMKARLHIEEQCRKRGLKLEGLYTYGDAGGRTMTKFAAHRKEYGNNGDGYSRAL